MNEIDFYEKVKNWDLYKILKVSTDSNSRILDLRTVGGEKVLKYFSDCKEILATDLSKEVINTANENLKASGR